MKKRDSMALTYCISISVVISISSLKSFAVAFCRLLAKVPGTKAPEFTQASENADAAVAA